jgi:hypothetical protein
MLFCYYSSVVQFEIGCVDASNVILFAQDCFGYEDFGVPYEY